MIKNAEILKGIEFNNIDDELLKKALIDKFSKNINILNFLRNFFIKFCSNFFLNFFIYLKKVGHLIWKTERAYIPLHCKTK